MEDFKFTNFESFLKIVQLITKENLAQAKQLLKTKGKDIQSIDDIFINDNGELFELLPDGTLLKVNLYIAIQEVDINYFNINNIVIQKLPKYHIYHCTTISSMFNSGRKHRYKVNNRDNGTFYYTFTNSHGISIATNEFQKLNVCKNCLAKFLHRPASDTDVANFDLKDFHKKGNNFFDDDISDMEQGEYAQPNVYSRTWDRISTQIKKKRNYICEECGYKPKNQSHQKFIHTHHVNGNKQNNHEDNLRVLCIKCHSNIDSYHARIKASAIFKEFIAIY